MRIIDIDQALEEYAKKKGQFRKISRMGLFDQRDIVKLRHFRDSLSDCEPQRNLTGEELSILSVIIQNKNTIPGRLSYEIFESLEGVMRLAYQQTSFFRSKKCSPPNISQSEHFPVHFKQADSLQIRVDISELPKDIIVMIFRYLNKESFFSLSRVNKKFFTTSKDQPLSVTRNRFLTQHRELLFTIQQQEQQDRLKRELEDRLLEESRYKVLRIEQALSDDEYFGHYDTPSGYTYEDLQEARKEYQALENKLYPGNDSQDYNYEY